MNARPWESRLSTTAKVAEWLEDLEKGRVVLVVNLSAGKDSAAVDLVLTEAEIPHQRVFADTGWEAPETYQHLEVLREKLGPIDVVGVPGGMEKKIRDGARFPSRRQRWCTRELKLEPLRAYYDAGGARGREAICVLGIRAEEAEERAFMPVVEDDDTWGGWLWRPIREWVVGDVIAIHRRHGVPMNPLYFR